MYNINIYNDNNNNNIGYNINNEYDNYINVDVVDDRYDKNDNNNNNYNYNIS